MLAFDFSERKIAAAEFVDRYMEQWRQERDSGELLADSSELSEILSSTFCLADLFNADASREDYEFDEDRLRVEIDKLLKGADSRS